MLSVAQAFTPWVGNDITKIRPINGPSCFKRSSIPGVNARAKEKSRVSNRHTLAALQKLTIAGFAFELALVNDDGSPRQNGFDRALNRLAFVGAVINVHVVGLNAD